MAHVISLTPARARKAAGQLDEASNQLQSEAERLLQRLDPGSPLYVAAARLAEVSRSHRSHTLHLLHLLDAQEARP